MAIQRSPTHLALESHQCRGSVLRSPTPKRPVGLLKVRQQRDSNSTTRNEFNHLIGQSIDRHVRFDDFDPDRADVFESPIAGVERDVMISRFEA